ncbi:hypothetical protein [Labilibaculum euxinus]|uniref:Uncharacterized protein n=1 Tax=Labilibaculum euxinus TaxID=2686357 RepID=A0A7M4D544_9BACT|nr:hypothetical protein [Labilibaculum euxinus]MUP37773.1 hypothetical protein [Labilibaculum euxinus]MVB06978.1 hypothetical protein [Labilibaculum euxinus]
MSDQSDLEILLDEINAIANENIKHCDMPFEIYIYEAERLHTRATEDLSKLSAVNMPVGLIDKLHTRTKALSRAQLNWVELTGEKKQAMTNFKAETPALLKLRKHLIDNMQFAFRNDKDLLKKIRDIKKGNSLASIIFDLALLARLGKSNVEALQAINFDLSLCDKATEEYERISSLLAVKDSKMYIPDEMLLIRNKAFTLLKQVVDEIRRYGKFVFRDKPGIVKAYQSEHHCKRNAEYYNNKKNNSSQS